MFSFKRVYSLISRPDFWPLVVILFLGWLASRTLFQTGYFNMHDDLQIMRLVEMEKCFLDGQIPCRWVPDMGFGFGFPLFNYYPPLPYLTGMLFRLVGFGYIDTAKGLFAFAFMASGVTMYYFAKQFFGKLGGILSAAFYIWAPYHSVDVYVRGAMNEAWALIWFPSVLLSIYKLIHTDKKGRLKWTIYFALSAFALLTSHNLMVLIFAPVALVWTLFWIVRTKNWNRVVNLGAGGFLGLGLAAFFTFPVSLEQRLVHADTLVKGYFEFTAHFVTTSQLLFSRFWGYGPSVWMDMDDKMSFQIGHLHWILATVIAAVAAMVVLNRRKDKDTTNNALIVLFFVAVGWFAAFMTHNKSTVLWQAVEPIKFVQFPWRFLTLVIFGFSFVVGWLANLLPKKFVLPVVTLLTIVLVAFNFNFFLPELGHMGPVTDQEKTSGIAWSMQQTAGIYDYLPIAAKQNPREGYREVATVIQGEVAVTDAELGTNWARFNTKSNQESEIRLNIYQFPNWKTFVDGVEVQNYVPEKEPWGRMHLMVPEGNHEVTAKLYDTPVRFVGNIISLFCWCLLVLILLKKRVRLG
jgi:hypothetical protein